ncbi:malate dehydrogenase, NAD-dependent [Thecamonas trahens ATCC 50062]|uniref:Malate dehydrogenase n=1 Tax=Thecamonas trahens ATCC 50062 TaxID=461836 RepID=A0A0L0D4G8_THETB|nr:malate dehydrogenase, NAD-dependent [Thecamonas trahens ATCC 50062]KNC46996.1 malate dehydrogenase, NAD-dependent [Thecamonas trahens ATCC 50062]|eukprot:XP_013759779.1 malate dehydrogenase, NAD-dependent [Thecamonas trahens ATCC 50062]
MFRSSVALTAAVRATGVASGAVPAAGVASISSGKRAASTASGFKVAVAGASGGIGQPLSLLLRNSQYVSDLRLYDIVGAPGVAADLSHIPSKAGVSGYGKDDVEAAFADVDCVVVPAGVPRKPGMTRDDLFNTNASIVQSLAEAIASAAPNAFVCIISNPVNSTVPIVAETLKKAGVYDPKKVFGVTTLDVIRANQFVGHNQNIDPKELDVTVVGGHAGTTILPLLSQIEGAKFTDDDIAALTHRIQFGGDEVVQAKDGAGSATLSMAVAGARFTDRLLAAASGVSGIRECTFVESNVADTPFFSSRVQLGPSGAEVVEPIGPMTAFEQANYDEMIGTLGDQIQKGVDFVNRA